MSAVCQLNNQTTRLQCLHELGVLDSPHEAEFGALVPVAAAAVDRKPGKLAPKQRSLLCDLALAPAKSLKGRRALAERAEALAQPSQPAQRTRQPCEATPARVHSSDMGGLGCEVSERWLDTLGCTLDEVIGQHDSSFYVGHVESTRARMAGLLAKAHEESGEHAMMFFDLDGFRLVNDACGHSAGDLPLQQMSKLVADSTRASDTLARLDGDAAKEAGRNWVHVWFDTNHALKARHGKNSRATRLVQALDNNRLVLLAQRIEPLRGDAKGLQAEALLRLADDDGSLVAAAAFSPAAERFHLSGRIDRWVLGQGIDLLAQAGPEICHRVCLGITETAAITNLADTSVFIDDVRALGVRIALDDFGAGGASFGDLKPLSADVMKIDGQFITDMLSNPLNEFAVRCCLDVARVVGLCTLAELVETPEGPILQVLGLEPLVGTGMGMGTGIGIDCDLKPAVQLAGDANAYNALAATA